MVLNVITDSVFNPKGTRKRILWELLTKKSFRKRFFQSDFFYQQMLKKSPIPRKPLEALIPPQSITLENFFSKNGNVSPYELMVICAIIKARNPLRLLEIGTFDGNTTLQMGLNSAEEAILHTIDLAKDPSETRAPIIKSDLTFIFDAAKDQKRYLHTSISHKVCEHIGDSNSYDFLQFQKEGLLDLIFIDGGHSYLCVQTDTENALKVLSENGCILWHDFTPHFGSVFQFLCKLSQTLPLVHIEGTNLVFYCA